MTDNEILDKIYDDTVSGLTMLADTYSSLVYKIVYDILSDVATQKDIEECVKILSEIISKSINIALDVEELN